ncbi:hypothetical protein Asulf_01525 [Archaeoglobus sulfaticallidus PM70-1]|uniref:Uncharacterized protein n=1 Tax=Archaeoglobus sulfaticallidus PM70-1 TaxID=387631 RepID=N0BEU0_9EURY|nr:hypothetical protein [Archaeoglobus sulfaticallidus]AGK61503.1 hypothetical protein Asulf_01525 [Archaeoglobus sulfaticallidus PM70-1]
MPAEQYSTDDIKVFVDGVELNGLKDLSITLKDKDNLKPIKDWADRTKGWAIKKKYVDEINLLEKIQISQHI